MVPRAEGEAVHTQQGGQGQGHEKALPSFSSPPPPPSQPHSLQTCRIAGPPPAMFYVANFISPAEEAALLKKVYEAPQPQWRVLAHRRLQSLPSPLTAGNVLLEASLPQWLQAPVKSLLQLPLDDRSLSSEPLHLFSQSPHQAPNHCLVNEYLPGQGIMPHEDGPAYHPITATVSLGSHAVLNVTDKDALQDDHEDSGKRWRILCEPRSLLITTQQAYKDTLHGIEAVHEDSDLFSPSDSRSNLGLANWELLGDIPAWTAEEGSKVRETRVSLTYRDVLKVKSIKGLGIFGQGRRT